MKPSQRLAFLVSLVAAAAGGCTSVTSLFTGDDKPWPDSTCEVPSCSAEELAGDDPSGFTAHACLRDDLDDPVSASGEALADLDPTASCDDLTDYVREVLLHTTRLTLERNLQRALEIHCTGCYDYDPTECNNCMDSSVGEPIDDPGADDYSQTNTQVPGIDEADFVKNDGNYLYLVDSGGLTIVDAWPAADSHVVSTLPLPGTPLRLYVHADRAIVYSRMGTSFTPDCTYGYDCDFLGDGQPMTLSVIDISDRAAPQLVRQLATNSAYLSSRRIGDIVHTVVMAQPLFLPDLPEWPEGIARYTPTCDAGVLRHSPEEIAAAFQTLWLENQVRIAAVSLDDIMPTLTERRWQDGVPSEVERRLAICDRSYLPRTHDGLSLITLMSFDATQNGEIGLTTVFGKPGAVYASADALYLAQPHRRNLGWSWFWESEPEATTLHKFRLTSGTTQTSYAGSGVVKGRVLNPFAMDEQDGFLRIATTSNDGWGSLHNTVATLHEAEGGLAVAGMIDAIAPGEEIRSVRFQGDLGYLVTFRVVTQMDPLFVVDLSDPTHPVLRGELHIPGFSTYLHMLDHEHLLSIGFDGDGWDSLFQSVMLQVMDVGDLDAPDLLHQEIIGTLGSASDAAVNHLAFNYHAPRELLAVPMVVCQPSLESDYGGRVSFEGLQVYRVSLAEGFTLVGGIPHSQPYDLDPWHDCGEWWSQSSSPVARSVFLEDWVFSIAADKIQVAPLSDLANPVATIPR